MSKLKSLLFPAIILFALSCEDNVPQDSMIPRVPVNEQVNINTPLHSALQNPGGFAYIQGGSRSIVVIHSLSGRFIAYDRNCAFRPMDDCSQVEMHSSVAFLRCGQSDSSGCKSCCGTRYNLDGEVIDGPGLNPLLQYRVDRSGNNIYINSNF